MTADDDRRSLPQTGLNGPPADGQAACHFVVGPTAAGPSGRRRPGSNFRLEVELSSIRSKSTRRMVGRSSRCSRASGPSNRAVCRCAARTGHTVYPRGAPRADPSSEPLHSESGGHGGRAGGGRNPHSRTHEETPVTRVPATLVDDGSFLGNPRVCQVFPKSSTACARAVPTLVLSRHDATCFALSVPAARPCDPTQPPRC